MILKKKKNVVSYLRKGRQMIDKKEIINNEENGNLAAMSDQKV